MNLVTTNCDAMPSSEGRAGTFRTYLVGVLHVPHEREEAQELHAGQEPQNGDDPWMQGYAGQDVNVFGNGGQQVWDEKSKSVVSGKRGNVRQKDEFLFTCTV